MEHSINDWGFSFAVVVTGLVVVFAVLLILVFICAIMGKIFATIDKNKADKQKSEPNTPPASTTTVTSSGTSGVMQIKQAGISNEIVAAISAAVSVVLEKDGVKTPFVLKSIKRAKNSRPLWNEASVRDNTRPF